MIGFENVHKVHIDPAETKLILHDATLMFEPTERIAVLANAGSGKTTLVELLTGLQSPTRGTMHRKAKLSWPLGFAGAFHPAMTGEENVKSVAMMAGEDADYISAYVAAFSELEGQYYRPLSGYSSSMRAVLAFATSLAIPADLYVSDEKVGVGDKDMRAKCEAALRQRLRRAGLFLVTRNVRLAKSYGERFAVLRNGKFVECEDFEEAEAMYEETRGTLSDIESVMAGFRAA